MRSSFAAFFIMVSVLVHAGAAFAENSPPRYTFGVVPQYEQRKLHDIWAPIIAELERRTGMRFELITTLKINDFEKEYQAGTFDFVYMNPYFMVKGAQAGRYLPLVRDKKPLRGILVVKKDGAVKTIADLQGKTVAFPSPNALGACLLMRSELERRFGVTVVPLYVKTHSSVYLHVATGLAAAGGGVQKTLQEQDASIRDLLTVLHTTRQMPSHPIAANQRVPETVREKVRNALLAMGKTIEGKALLAKVPIEDAIPASLEEYQVMSQWGLDKYWDDSWREE